MSLRVVIRNEPGVRTPVRGNVSKRDSEKGVRVTEGDVGPPVTPGGPVDYRGVARVPLDTDKGPVVRP